MAGKVRAGYKELVRTSGGRVGGSGLAVGRGGGIGACGRAEGGRCGAPVGAAQGRGGPVRGATSALPGPHDLADAAIDAIGKDSNACLLRSHGAVCIGADMDSAFKVATVLEMVSEIYWRILATGNDYQPISAENVAAMQEFVKTKYGQY